MPDQPLFGAIADDYTGAADLAGMLSERGVRTALLLGVPDERTLAEVGEGYDAYVIALKSRSIPKAEACAQSLEALDRLRALGVRQVQFKYCSTFDSTADGNIGPVTEALLSATGAAFTAAVPALPVNGRTQYLGHLFVGGRLLSESHMRHHPVTPMTDSDLVRHLQRQTPLRVGLVALPAVQAGAGAIRREFDRLQADGVRIALVDAVGEADLLHVAEAVADLPLVTGGSGLGMALPEVWRRAGRLQAHHEQDAAGAGSGGVLILSGSCSAVTLEQLRAFGATGGSGVAFNVARLAADEAGEGERLFREIEQQIQIHGWALAYSSAPVEERERALGALAGQGISGDAVRERIERATARLARRAVEAGLVDRLVIAGGETTGAVTEGLEIRALAIGETIDPGVPIVRSLAGPDLTLVFKSGNFGGPDFFTRALRRFGCSLDDRRPPTADRREDMVR